SGRGCWRGGRLGSADDPSLGRRESPQRRSARPSEVATPDGCRSGTRCRAERAEDPDLLEWAAGESRVMLTRDARTVIGYGHERVAQGLPMPGGIVVRQPVDIGRVLEDLTLIIECPLEGELKGQVLYIPFG